MGVHSALHPLELGTPTWDRPGPPGLGERDGSTSLTKDVGVRWPPGTVEHRATERERERTRLPPVKIDYYQGRRLTQVKVIIPRQSPDPDVDGVLVPISSPRLDSTRLYTIYIIPPTQISSPSHSLFCVKCVRGFDLRSGLFLLLRLASTTLGSPTSAASTTTTTALYHNQNNSSSPNLIPSLDR